MDQQPASRSSWLRRLAAKLLPPATPQPEDRESIWSINRRDTRTFFRLVGVLWLVALAYIIYKTLNEPASEWKAASSESWWQIAGDFALVVMYDFSGVAIGIAILLRLRRTDPSVEPHRRVADVALSSHGEPLCHPGH